MPASLQPKSGVTSGAEKLRRNWPRTRPLIHSAGQVCVVAVQTGSWGHRRVVERAVVLAFPKPVRLCLVGEPAARAKGAVNQVSRMLASANPIPTSNS